MWKNIVERVSLQMTIWRMGIACWMTKATNTHSQYVTLIAFPLQKWLQEPTSVLRYTYIVCLVAFCLKLANNYQKVSTAGLFGKCLYVRALLCDWRRETSSLLNNLQRRKCFVCSHDIIGYCDLYLLTVSWKGRRRHCFYKYTIPTTCQAFAGYKCLSDIPFVQTRLT